MGKMEYTLKIILVLLILSSINLHGQSLVSNFPDLNHREDQYQIDMSTTSTRYTVAIDEALKYLQEKFEVNFSYLSDLKTMKAVPFRWLQEEDLEFSLDMIFKNSQFTYNKVGEGFYVIFLKDSGLKKPNKSNTIKSITNKRLQLDSRPSVNRIEYLPTNRTIYNFFAGQILDVSGRIIDVEGNPLIGVNVLVKGSDLGTATDFDGNFTLENVDNDAILVVSYIGYKTQEVPVDGNTTLEITLEEDSQTLDEVVVVGYGTQRRRSVTGSVASVPMEDLESKPIVGVDQAINGKVAGVQVNTVSGTPGGGPSIRIRGVSSIGAGSDPLYVIDGFPISNSPDQRSNPLNSIAPSQIVSIEILKDASATAIYGSRGANGVILITTKKGSMGLNVDFNSSIGLQNIRRRGMIPVLNATEFAQFMNDRISDNIRYNQNREPTVDDIPEMYRNPEQYGEGTNWVEEIYRTALMQNHNLNISGGNEKIRTMVSFGFLDQDGTLLETNYNRYNLRINVNANLTDRLSMGFNLAPSLENQKLAATDGDEGRAGPQASAYLVNPIAPLRNEDGSLTSMVSGPGLLAYVNPVLKLQEVDHTLKTGRALFNTFLNFEIIENLNFKSSFNIDWRTLKREQYEPTTVGQAFNVYPPDIAIASLNTSTALNWVNENTLNYNTQIGEDHNINALLGFSLQNETFESESFNAREFPDDEIRTFNAAPTITGSTNISEWSLVSGFARLIYDYRDKYLLTAAMRMDGSSKFGADNRWGSFPSISLGWRISNEGFLEGNSTLTNLMLRAGYGRTGNFSIGNYTHLGRVGTSSYVLNDVEVAGRSINNLGNPNLGWEEVDQVNIGLDASINDRHTFTLEYYRKITNNMLLSIETPYTSGFQSAQVNRGEVTNHGVEFSYNTTVIQKGDFTWDLGLNVSHNSNKVTRLASPIFAPVATAQHITEEGYPIGQFYGYNVLGIFDTQEEIDNAPLHPSAIPGSYRYEDVNGDGQIDPITDFTRIGDPYPDFTWGLNNSINLKSWDLNIAFTGSQGGQKIQNGYQDFHNLDGVFNVHTDALNRWRSPENPGDGLVPRAISRVIHRYNHSKWVENSSHIWIRNISIGYSMDENSARFLESGNRLRIYLNILNPWISNTNFQNPEEAYEVQNPLRPGGTRNLNYPISKVYSLGINVNL
ncbi:SusC/RagA family TonB-linked outer membrane protein [Membranihabitans maritimus]|uniref:SusC/RagA family TonB-linked outer membrane protein n=1 Tax=Membranihabitans maritimus TaxID=2904244 RepID=UPI001F393F4C|nr:TonB-dependent receptor [Membranihabitans maritimus]